MKSEESKKLTIIFILLFLVGFFVTDFLLFRLISAIGIAGMQIQYAINFEKEEKSGIDWVIFGFISIVSVLVIDLYYAPEYMPKVLFYNYYGNKINVFIHALLMLGLGFSGLVINLYYYLKERR